MWGESYTSDSWRGLKEYWAAAAVWEPVNFCFMKTFTFLKRLSFYGLFTILVKFYV